MGAEGLPRPRNAYPEPPKRGAICRFGARRKRRRICRFGHRHEAARTQHPRKHPRTPGKDQQAACDGHGPTVDSSRKAGRCFEGAHRLWTTHPRTPTSAGSRPWLNAPKRHGPCRDCGGRHRPFAGVDLGLARPRRLRRPRVSSGRPSRGHNPAGPLGFCAGTAPRGGLHLHPTTRVRSAKAGSARAGRF